MVGVIHQKFLQEPSEIKSEKVELTTKDSQGRLSWIYPEKGGINH